ncbi:hypothetical protein AHAS_Ahas15G0254500 [Arachis hypogaea]
MMEVSGAVLRNVTCPSFSMHVSSSGGGGCVMVKGREEEGEGNHYVERKEKLKMLKKRVLFDDLQGNLTLVI